MGAGDGYGRALSAPTGGKMKTLRSFFNRFAGLFSSTRRDREFTDELDSHVALAADDLVRSGMPEAEARRQAVLEIGGTQSAREAYREQGSVPWFEHLLRDLRYGTRM